MKINLWTSYAKNLLKGELARQGITNAELAKCLAAMGIKETKASIDSKISRGTFSAAFLLQCLEAIGCEQVKNLMTKSSRFHMAHSNKAAEGVFFDSKSGVRFIDINKKPQPVGAKPTVISLFSGAGGIDIGLETAGFETLICVDSDADCRATLQYNRPNWNIFDSSQRAIRGKLVERNPGDIRQIDPEELLEKANRKKGEVTLVVGGAPCQPFSNIGKKKGKSDEKNGDLFLEFVRMVKGIDPKAFIFENVVGITQGRHADVINYMTRQFSDMDYGISHTILNAANYGVPQRRERFFLIGVKGVDQPAFPLPTHFRNDSSWEVFTKFFDATPKEKPRSWVSLRKTFASLPKNYKSRSDFAVMNVSKTVEERIKLIKEGENFKVLPMKMRPDCWKSGLHLGSDTFGRLVSDLPSVTIRTAAYNPSKGRYIHPTEHRGLNTVEMAAIQGFPYAWEFRTAGKKITLVSAGKQIGNAVPPPLAEALGRAIKLQL